MIHIDTGKKVTTIDGGSMRNQISFDLPPQDLFLNPGQDKGLSLLAPADYFWRSVAPAVITGFPASAHAEMNYKIGHHLNYIRRNKAFTTAIEFNSLPVVLEQASFRKSYSLVGEKAILSGASGTRLLNSYIWANRENGQNPEEQLVAYFRQCQSINEAASLPVSTKSLPKKLPIAIECRNTFNYYHFTTESLSQLAHLIEMGFDGEVFFHFPNDPEKTRPFAQGFVTALFPELEGRVHFDRTPKAYDQALTVFDLSCAYYQFPPETIGSVDQFCPSDRMFRGRDAYRSSAGILEMNSFHTALKALRHRALRAIEGGDYSHLPRRFFVGRDNRQSRSRVMAGQDALLEALGRFGFDYVAFENLTPLEQIAIMANAEMMISYHGAGFTNMLFANPEAFVIELGTLQTAMHRWGDFWGIAHVAGCRYISFFADFNQPDPLAIPSFGQDGIVPVALSDQGLAKVMTFIDSILGKLPSLNNADAVETLAKQLIAVREYTRVLLLLESHAGFMEGNLTLCLVKAECHKLRDEPQLELRALRMAYEADTNRWQTLVRIVWCARRCEEPDVMRWALSALQKDFPERFDALTESKPALRRMV